MWLFYSLLSALLIGVGQVITKKGLAHTTPLFNNLLAVFFAVTIMAPYALLHGVDFQKLWHIYPYMFIVTLCYIGYYYILEMGQVSLTGTIVASYPVFTILFSTFYLYENPDFIQWLAVLMVILGTCIIALPRDKKSLKRIVIGSWFWWAFFGAVIIGFADFFAKIQINNSDVYTYLFGYVLAWVPLVIISALFDKKGRKVPKFVFKKYLPTLIGVTMLETAWLVFSIALSLGYASLVTSVSSVYVGITVILAYIFLKEKITRLQLIGILFSFVGIILISF